MNSQKAYQLARQAIELVTVGESEPVADTTVLILNADGTYSVTDNGEEVDSLTADQAIVIMVENLTADKER